MSEVTGICPQAFVRQPIDPESIEPLQLDILLPVEVVLPPVLNLPSFPDPELTDVTVTVCRSRSIIRGGTGNCPEGICPAGICPVDILPSGDLGVTTALASCP